MTNERSTSRSERLFAALLLLFPREFRQRFGGDMRDLFRDQLRAARSSGDRTGILGLWWRTLPSLARTILLEHRDAPRRARVHRTSPSSRPGSDGMMQSLATDLRYAGRMLRRSPVFTIVAVVAVSSGTGAVTTIFSAMNAVVLRPLPGAADGDRLVGILRTNEEGSEGMQGSYAYYRHLRDGTRSLDGVAAWSKASLTIADRGAGHAVDGNIVSGNYFSVLGVRPALGRFFLPDEDVVPMARPVIVVSHGFWTTQLGADSTVIGRPVKVNGHPYTLIGVAPAGFRGVFTPLRIDAWVPLMMQAQLRPGRDLGESVWLWMFGRLADGANRAGARAELETLTASHAREAPELRGRQLYVHVQMSALTGLPEDARRAFLGFMGLLLAASALVLMIASVNVASMLSARALSRRREMALRTALGAGRRRLVRQLLTETLLLFVLGAVGGVVLAWFATAAFERLRVPGNVTVALELSPDFRVLSFALLLSLVTGIVFGLAPALQAARRDIMSRLREDSAGTGTRRSFVGSALMVGQLAFSLVLLVAAGLFLRALERGAGVDPGFRTSGVVTAWFNAESWGYDETRARIFYTELRARLERLPGVIAVSYTGVLPLTLSGSADDIRLDGTTAAADDNRDRVRVQVAAVDEGYFEVLQLPIVSGRAFSAADDVRAPRVAIVNETLMRRHFPDGNALGRTFGYRGGAVTIIGVARDAKYQSLSEAAPPFAYFPIAQIWRADQALLVRTAANAASLAPGVIEAVRAIDPALPRPAVRTLEHETSIALLPQRVAATVTGALGLVGLLLATVGLYGMMAWSVGRRTREMGVRVALGARHSDVLGMIVREGMRLAVIGVFVGLILAAATTRLLSKFLFSVSPLDATTFIGMSVVFVFVALLASYLPARRAAGADPMSSLRAD